MVVGIVQIPRRLVEHHDPHGTNPPPHSRVLLLHIPLANIEARVVRIHINQPVADHHGRPTSARRSASFSPSTSWATRRISRRCTKGEWTLGNTQRCLRQRARHLSR